MRASTSGSRPSFVQLRFVAILAGGAGGALARGGLQRAFPADGGWPWGTFIANLAGTFVLGWLVTRLTERVAPTRLWRPFLGTGLCGAFTTFSAFQVLQGRPRPGGSGATPATSLRTETASPDVPYTHADHHDRHHGQHRTALADRGPTDGTPRCRDNWGGSRLPGAWQGAGRSVSGLTVSLPRSPVSLGIHQGSVNDQVVGLMR